MKKNLFYLFLLMSIAVMPLTSCKENDEDPQDKEEQHNPKSDSDQEAVTSYDALSWLQGSIVVVNENNEVVRRVYGKPLDESQPDVISVPVTNYATAENIFLSWVAPGKSASKVDGGYDYNLTDANGNAQGSVSFRAVEDEDGVIARMSVAEGTDLKQVSEFNFVDYDLWPENASYSTFEAGQIYEFVDYEINWIQLDFMLGEDFNYKGAELKPLVFYCIQGNTDGKEGILVWLSPDVDDSGAHPKPYYYIKEKAYLYLPTVAEAQKVLDIYNSDNAFWNKMLKEMDERDYDWSYNYGFWTTGNDEFLLNEYNTETKKIKCLDLDQDDEDEVLGKICDVKSDTDYKYRYMHIRIIPPVM